MRKKLVHLAAVAATLVFGLSLPIVGSDSARAATYRSAVSAYSEMTGSTRGWSFTRHHRRQFARHSARRVAHRQGRHIAHHLTHHVSHRLAHHLAHHSAHHLAHHLAHHQPAGRRHHALAQRHAPALVHLALRPTRPSSFDANQAGRPLELHPLLAVASRYIGHGRVSHHGGPWCRDFINTVARQAGYRLANTSRRAIDALSLGHRVSSPRPGDLVVMRHHVTIFAGYGGRGVIGLGGNQGHGRVKYSTFNRGRVVGYVRL